MSIKPPHSFTRLPRSLKDRAHWKASEWRHWLLFYSLPCMAKVLPHSFWNHWKLLVEANHILLQEQLSPLQIDRAGEQAYSCWRQLYFVCRLHVHMCCAKCGVPLLCARNCVLITSGFKQKFFFCLLHSILTNNKERAHLQQNTFLYQHLIREIFELAT